MDALSAGDANTYWKQNGATIEAVLAETFGAENAKAMTDVLRAASAQFDVTRDVNEQFRKHPFQKTYTPSPEVQAELDAIQPIVAANPSLLAILSGGDGKFSEEEVGNFLKNALKNMSDAAEWLKNNPGADPLTSARNKQLATLWANNELIRGSSQDSASGFTFQDLQAVLANNDKGIVTDDLKTAARQYTGTMQFGQIDTGTGITDWKNDRDNNATTEDIKKAANLPVTQGSILSDAYMNVIEHGKSDANAPPEVRDKLEQIWFGVQAQGLISQAPETGETSEVGRNKELARATNLVVERALSDPAVSKYLADNIASELDRSLPEGSSERQTLTASAWKEVSDLAGAGLPGAAEEGNSNSSKKTGVAIADGLWKSSNGNLEKAMATFSEKFSTYRLMSGPKEKEANDALAEDVGNRLKSLAQAEIAKNPEFEKNFETMAGLYFDGVNPGKPGKAKYIELMKKCLDWYKAAEKLPGGVAKFLDAWKKAGDIPPDSFFANAGVQKLWQDIKAANGGLAKMQDLYSKGFFHQLHALYGGAAIMTKTLAGAPKSEDQKLGLAAACLTTASNMMEGLYKGADVKNLLTSDSPLKAYLDKIAQGTIGGSADGKALDIGASGFFKLLSGAADGIGTFLSIKEAIAAARAGNKVDLGLAATGAASSGLGLVGTGLELAGLGARMAAQAGIQAVRLVAIGTFLEAAGGALGAVAGAIGIAVLIAQGARKQIAQERSDNDFKKNAEYIFGAGDQENAFGRQNVEDDDGDNIGNIRELYLAAIRDGQGYNDPVWAS